MRARVATDSAGAVADPTAAWGCLPLLAGALVLLLIGTILREQPAFWTNAGGYPVWVRTMVSVLYWPGLVVSGPALAVWSGWMVLQAACRKKGMVAVLVVVVLMWAAMGVVVAWMAWNNLENLFEGRDLHYHESRTIQAIPPR